MATASITNTFVAGTAAEAAQVNTNFTNVVDFLNNSVVHKDGTKAMTANFDAGTNKIVNLTAGTASTDAANIANVNAVLPVGMMTAYGGSSAPSLWALCDGTAISRATYSALFAVIGTSFGVGDGSTTFNLPDLRDKYPIGDSSTLTLGGSVGSNDAVVVTHNHTQDAHGHGNTLSASQGSHGHSGSYVNGTWIAGGTANPSGTMASPTYPGAESQTSPSVTVASASAGAITLSGGVSSQTATNQAQGVSGTNANRPASVVVNWIIRTGV